MCIFSQPSAPTMVAIPQAPTAPTPVSAPAPVPVAESATEREVAREVDLEVEAAVMEEERKLKSSKNSTNNVLTSGLGLTTQEQVKTPTILGK